MNQPEPLLIRGVATLLVQSLTVSPGEVWLISPWLRDVRLPVAAAGTFRPVLSDAGDEMRLGDLLARVAKRHTLHIITKPPAELVDLRTMLRLEEKLQARQRLGEEEELKGYSVIEDLASGLDADIRLLADSLTVHAETVRLGLELRSAGAQLSYRDKLHAKLLWTPLGAMVGSANFTNGGLAVNDELVLEVTDPAAHQALQSAARQMSDRARQSHAYSLRRALERAGTSAATVRGLRGSTWLANETALLQLLELLDGLLSTAA
jgi:phosphatidylserine/phosphatidylglycerophosphate/cardiolipin synthase-like enzyme